MKKSKKTYTLRSSNVAMENPPFIEDVPIKPTMDRGWAEGKQAINRQKRWEFQSSIANYTHCSISSLYQRSIPEIVMERSTKMMNSGAVKCSNGDLTNKNCGIMGYFMGIFQLAPHFGNMGLSEDTGIPPSSRWYFLNRNGKFKKT